MGENKTKSHEGKDANVEEMENLCIEVTFTYGTEKEREYV